MMRPAKRILVVDDEKTILLSLAYALKSDGVEVITCNRTEWAEKALQGYYFDLVITDIRLSKTGSDEGLDILEFTKKRHPNAKVIVMTAYGTDEIRERARELGADHYFDKPIDLDLLLQTVTRLGVPLKRERSGFRLSWSEACSSRISSGFLRLSCFSHAPIPIPFWAMPARTTMTS